MKARQVLVDMLAESYGFFVRPESKALASINFGVRR